MLSLLLDIGLNVESVLFLRGVFNPKNWMENKH